VVKTVWLAGDKTTAASNTTTHWLSADTQKYSGERSQIQTCT